MFDKTNKYIAEGVAVGIAIFATLVIFLLMQQSTTFGASLFVAVLWGLAALSLSRRFLFARSFWLDINSNRKDAFLIMIGFFLDVLMPFFYLTIAIIATIAAYIA